MSKIEIAIHGVTAVSVSKRHLSTSWSSRIEFAGARIALGFFSREEPTLLSGKVKTEGGFTPILSQHDLESVSVALVQHYKGDYEGGKEFCSIDFSVRTADGDEYNVGIFTENNNTFGLKNGDVLIGCNAKESEEAA